MIQNVAGSTGRDSVGSLRRLQTTRAQDDVDEGPDENEDSDS